MLSHVIIAGGRMKNNFIYGYTVQEMWVILRDYMHELRYHGPAVDQEPTIEEVISGCATGIDSLGEQWADCNWIPIKQFPADWKLGKSAGIKRNILMGDYAKSTGQGALVALHDGVSPGTKHMIGYATKIGLKVHVHLVKAKTE